MTTPYAVHWHSSKIGEAYRPSTYAPPVRKVGPTTSEANEQMQWLWNESKPEPYWTSPANTAADASDTAKAWLAHPANKMQVLTKFGAVDDDGDGVMLELFVLCDFFVAGVSCTFLAPDFLVGGVVSSSEHAGLNDTDERLGFLLLLFS